MRTGPSFDAHPNSPNQRFHCLGRCVYWRHGGIILGPFCISSMRRREVKKLAPHHSAGVKMWSRVCLLPREVILLILPGLWRQRREHDLLPTSRGIISWGPFYLIPVSWIPPKGTLSLDINSTISFLTLIRKALGPLVNLQLTHQLSDGVCPRHQLRWQRP